MLGSRRSLFLHVERLARTRSVGDSGVVGRVRVLSQSESDVTVRIRVRSGVRGMLMQVKDRTTGMTLNTL
jgi:hypothetical protein